MSLDWYPGQQVVCITDYVQFPNIRTPQKGVVYTIRETTGEYDDVGVRLVEIVNPEMNLRHPTSGKTVFTEMWFKVGGLRPLKESRIDQFRKYLVKKPERQDA